jgi:hypothetical protein
VSYGPLCVDLRDVTLTRTIVGQSTKMALDANSDSLAGNPDSLAGNPDSLAG